MKKLIVSMIVSAFILAPALSMAQTKPAEKPKTEACCKGEKKACCKEGEKKACCAKEKKAEAPKK